MLRRRAHRGGQREARFLAALQLRGHRQEVGDGLVLVGVAVEVGAQPRRRGHRRGVFEADHHVADRPVTDVGHGSGDGDDRLAGRGGNLRGDLIDSDLDEGCRAGLACGGGGKCEPRRQTGQDADHHDEAQQGGPSEPRATRARTRVVSPPHSCALHCRRRLRPGPATVLPASNGLVRPSAPGARVGLRTPSRRAGRQRWQRRQAVGL